MLKSRKAQIGETMTWVIATIAIIGILLIFTFMSSFFAKANGQIVSLKKVFSDDSIEDVDWIKNKTDLAYQKDPTHKPIIDEWINKMENSEK